MELHIDRQGNVHCVYDEMLDLSCLGQISISRASHVEADADGQWWADLQPVAGPKLGPFDRRSEALAAEKEWLEKHLAVTNSPRTVCKERRGHD
jgi:hypothetical protein